MRKTNYLQIVTFDLQRAAGPYRRATSRHSALIFSADNGYPLLLRVNLSVEFPD